jgi:hypothetical protein
VSCFCDIYTGTISIGEYHQAAHVPSWQIVQLDVFDKPTTQQSMLEIKEDTQYGLVREVIIDAIEVGDNIVVPCKSGIGKQFWFFFFVINQNMW